jgi:hypothetical protein
VAEPFVPKQAAALHAVVGIAARPGSPLATTGLGQQHGGQQQRKTQSQNHPSFPPKNLNGQPGGKRLVEKCPRDIFQPHQVQSIAPHGSQNNDLRRFILSSHPCDAAVR